MNSIFMKTIERDVIDNSTNSPRLTNLKNHIEKWLDEYVNDKDEEYGINLIMFGIDKKYKHNIQFSLTGKEDPIEDIIQIFNHGFGQLEDDLKKDLFNGMCEYLARVFVEYPKLYELFKNNVEDIKNKTKDE